RVVHRRNERNNSRRVEMLRPSGGLEDREQRQATRPSISVGGGRSSTPACDHAPVPVGSVSYCFIVHHLSAREGNQVERHHPTDANAPSTLDKSRSVYRDNARTCGRGLLGHWQILVSHRVNTF